MQFLASAPFSIVDIVENDNGTFEADFPPTAYIIRNGVIDLGVPVTVTSPEAGVYCLGGTMGAYSVGDWVTVMFSYIVSFNTFTRVAAQGIICGNLQDLLGITTTQLATYADGTLATLFAKLDLGAASDPVQVIPAEPQSADTCRVYGYLVNLNNRPIANLSITAEVVPDTDPVTADGFFLSRAPIEFKTNEEGRIVDGDGNFYVDLVKTSSMRPSATEWKYKFVCNSLDLDLEVVLTDSVFNFADLVSNV